jgi:zinc and cadmium transporter
MFIALKLILPPMLMLVYCLVIVCGSLAGGIIPLLVRMTHTRMQLTLSFVGGAMLGVAVLHLLPHAFYELGSIQHTVGWLLGGFLFMFFIERVFHFHHHDTPADGDEHDHDHDAPHAGHEHRAPPRALGWQVAVIGLSLHSALDGVALAAAVASEAHEAGLAGLVVFLVVALHKPLDSMTLGALLAMGEHSPARRHLINGLYALTVPLGVGLFHLGADHAGATATGAIGAALAFTAGTFLCIATSDLLPELHFHRHDRFKLSAALLLGVALAAGLVMVEESWHEHSGHGHSAHEHAEDHHADDDHEQHSGDHHEGRRS